MPSGLQNKASSDSDNHELYPLQAYAETVEQNDPKRGSMLKPTESVACKWSLGWKVPLVILGGFLLALCLAIGNFIFFYKLDGRLVEDSLPQSYVSNIANAFVRAFSISLTLALSTAFTQLLWSRLRGKPLKVSTIDGLMSVPTSAVELLSVDMLRATFILWVFGLIIQLIPIATIFPPGALVVLPREWPMSEEIQIPIFDIHYRGNGTAAEIFENNVFLTNYDGTYNYPDDRIFSIAKRSALSGRYLTSASPCGTNCTYSIEYSGPKFSCEPNNAPELPGAYRNFSQNWLRQMNVQNTIISDSELVAVPTSRDERYVFDVQFPNRGGTNLSCTISGARYAANVSFVDGTQSIATKLLDEWPLNATALSTWDVWYLEVDSAHPNQNPLSREVSDNDYLNEYYAKEQANLTVGEAYAGHNIRAIADALTYSLSGYIYQPGSEAQDIRNTMLQQTQLISQNRSFQNTTFGYEKLTPAAFEELLHNVTISTLSEPNTRATANVTRTPWRNTYSFKQKGPFIVTYAVSLLVSACFITYGSVALLRNGVSAKSGGLLQVLCTTTGDSLEINKRAAQCCLGGDASLTKDLEELEVRFGELQDMGGRQVRRAGFGTAEETVPLRRGGNYGG